MGGRFGEITLGERAGGWPVEIRVMPSMRAGSAKQRSGIFLRNGDVWGWAPEIWGVVPIRGRQECRSAAKQRIHFFGRGEREWSVQGVRPG